MGRVFRFEAPLPPSCLRPNAKAQHRYTVEARNRYQQDVAYAIVAAGLRSVRLERAELRLDARWHRWEEAWDDDALVAAFKPGRDVLCEQSARLNPWGMGLIPDDSPRYLRLGGVTVRVSRDERPALWVTLVELEPLPAGATSNEGYDQLLRCGRGG